MTIKELAERIGGEVEGDAGREALGVCSLDEIRDGCVVFIEKQKDDGGLLAGKDLSAVICSKTAQIEGQTLIRCANPKMAFALALGVFHPPHKPAPGVHPTAVVEEGAEVDPAASVGPNCFVGAGAKIGAGAVLRANVVVGPRAVVGKDCLLHPNVTVLDECVLGDRVILHSGVVIGADGFGFVEEGGRRTKVPQVGRVIVEDDVEIGANSAVDRATMGETRIGRGTKIDNLVQVGHNVHIGEDCVLCGEVGISGSCRIGSRVILGGQAGVSDHIKIGDNVLIGGKTGVIADIPSGVFYSGFPARPHRENMKMHALLKKLPEIISRLEQFIGEEKKDGEESGK